MNRIIYENIPSFIGKQLVIQFVFKSKPLIYDITILLRKGWL